MLFQIGSEHGRGWHQRVCRQSEMAYQQPVISPLLSFFPLAAPAIILVSLLLQLMKATVLAESSFIFSPGSKH